MFDHYAETKKAQLLHKQVREQIALVLCFHTLQGEHQDNGFSSGPSTSSSSRPSSSKRPKHRRAPSQAPEVNERMSWKVWSDLIREVRPNITRTELQAYFTYLEKMDAPENELDEVTRTVRQSFALMEEKTSITKQEKQDTRSSPKKSSRSGLSSIREDIRTNSQGEDEIDGGLTLMQFLYTCDVLKMKVDRKKRRKYDSQVNYAEVMLPRNEDVAAVVDYWIFHYVVKAMVIINVVALSLQDENHTVTNFVKHDLLASVTFICQAFFVIEMALKIVAYGWADFMSQGKNKADLILTFLAFISSLIAVARPETDSSGWVLPLPLVTSFPSLLRSNSRALPRLTVIDKLPGIAFCRALIVFRLLTVVTTRCDVLLQSFYSILEIGFVMFGLCESWP